MVNHVWRGWLVVFFIMLPDGIFLGFIEDDVIPYMDIYKFGTHTCRGGHIVTGSAPLFTKVRIAAKLL